MARHMKRAIVEPVPFELGRPDIDTQWSHVGPGHGLSESDVMSRQRYFENSRPPSRVDVAVSLASNPGLPPPGCSSRKLHDFVQEQRKIVSSIRSQPWPMQMKLAAIRSYRSSIDKHASQLRMVDVCRGFMSKFGPKVRHKMRVLSESLTLWRTIIKSIEGQSGTSVASFFIFLRWLCALNCVLALLVLLFIILPQAILGHGLDVPGSVKKNGTSLSFILDGKGYLMEYSVLFYGYYDSGRNEPYLPPPPNPHPYLALHYKLPLAYVLVITGLFVLYCIAILVKMAIKYKTLQKAAVGERFPFSWMVFNSWDFAIAEATTARNKMKDITISLKETLAEVGNTEESSINIGLCVVRVFANSLVFLSLAGTSYGIYMAVDNTESIVHRKNFHEAFSEGIEGLKLFLASFQVQGVITARNLALPYIFWMAEWLERFHPRTALKMKLVRLFLLYVSSLYVLIIALFTLSTQCKSSPEGEGAGQEGAGQEGGSCCWENIIGQELFKLNLTHMMADLGTMAVDMTRWLLPKIPKINRLEKWIGPTEFRLADNVLRLIYGQALILLGVLFCPVLPVIGLIKYIVIFYSRSWVVYYCNLPPRNVFRVSSTLNFYLGMLLATALLCSFPVGYALLQMVPSESCGPFRGLDNMLHVVLDEIETWPTALKIAIDYMRTATVIVPVLALLGLQIYYYAVMSSALKEVNKDLKLQLRMEHAEIREKIAADHHHHHSPQLPHCHSSTNPEPHPHRHLQLQHALHSQQRSSTMHSLPHNPMMAEPDIPSTPHTSPPSHPHHHTTLELPPSHPHQHTTLPPSHPHANGLQDPQSQVPNPPPVLASSHTHH